MDLFNKKRLSLLENEISLLKSKNSNLEKELAQSEDVNKLKEEYKSYQEKLNDIKDEIYVQNVCLFEPIYKYSTTREYKDALKENRKIQKNIIKRHMGIIFKPNSLAIEGNLGQGNNLLDSMSNLMLSSFNLQCDSFMDKVGYNNLATIKGRIYKTVDKIENHGQIFDIKISEELIDLKINELELVHECACKEQEEKEERQIQREILKEQEKLEKEIAKEKFKLENEKSRLLSKMDRLVKEEDKIEIRGQIDAITTKISTNEYRLANQKCGYVYIISNNDLKNDAIKIGVTRQSDPMERVKQLSDASHAYKFNVHAFIWSEDVFKLESELHKCFSDKRVNLVNPRKELFYVDLNEIEKILKDKFNISVEIYKDVVNEEYIVSENMRKEKGE